MKLWVGFLPFRILRNFYQYISARDQRSRQMQLRCIRCKLIYIYSQNPKDSAVTSKMSLWQQLCCCSKVDVIKDHISQLGFIESRQYGSFASIFKLDRRSAVDTTKGCISQLESYFDDYYVMYSVTTWDDYYVMYSFTTWVC